MDTYITNILMWVNSGTNPPAAPTGLAAAPTSVAIPLTWNSSVAATNYYVKRSTTSSRGPYTTLATVDGTSYTDSSAVSGTLYYYVVSALDQFGESSNSAPVAASLVNAGFQLVAAPGSATIAAGGNTNFTVTMTTNASFTGTTSFGVTGLPTGAAASFNQASLNHAGTTTLTITTASNTPAGNYILTVQGTNGAFINTTNINLNVTSTAVSAGTLVWNGSTDVNWSTAPNWTNTTVGGYGPPGVSNSVVFTNGGAVTASALTAPGSGAIVLGNINSVVDGTVSIIGLTNFANAINSSPNYQNISIAPGVALTAGGLQVGGFGVYDFGANNTVNTTISGAGGALVVTNGGVTVSQGSGSSGAHVATLDLSGLDNFVLSGTQMRLGVENITRAGGIVYLARTNNLTLSTAGYVNSDGSGSPYSGNPALVLGHNKSALGNGSQLYLGLANTISVDYATIGRGDANDLLAFNPAFLAQNPTVTIQGTNGPGTRVGVYVVGDDSPGQGGSTANTNDFSGGTVNALVNYLGVGRGRQGASDTTTVSGYLTFNNGTINANTLAVGLLYPSGSNSIANGTVNVNGGTLTVLSNLALGTRPATGGSGTATGTLHITGGTVQATNITGAGGTANINLNSGFLDLQFNNPVPGQIAGVSTLNIGANSVGDPALLANASAISAANPITIAPNGTLAGNTTVSAPSLVINGMIAPGSAGVGTMVNNGTTVLGAGGSLAVAVQNASGSPGSGWDFLQANGTLDVESSGANPFTIALQSFDPNGSGLTTNFNPALNYDWPIASATAITNFVVNKFVVDSSLFQNNLAGGFFYVHTNNNSLVLSFTNGNPAVALNLAVTGTGLVLTGTNGVSGGRYYVLAATNLFPPGLGWQIVATNYFDASGSIDFTNPLNSMLTQVYYRLELP
jgi:hypothetical protein